MSTARVHQIAKEIKDDIDVTASVDARDMDKYINRMLSAATDALKVPVPPFSDLEMGNLAQLYESMKHSHGAVRQLLANGADDPRSVDALAVVRLQLETLFALYLIFEQPQTFSSFIKSSWKKLYVRHLLTKTEGRKLPRFKEVEAQLEISIEGMRRHCGVDDDEKLTIEIQELGTVAPKGFKPKQIRSFPLPSRVIDLVKDRTAKDMLQRLYPEYAYLCSFTHASPDGWLVRTMLNARSPYRKYMEAAGGSASSETVFQKQVAEPSILLSVISVAQCCAELTTKYPGDYTLLAETTQAWNWLCSGSLLGKSIWERRTKKLLKAII